MVPQREIKGLNVGGRIKKNLVQHGGLIPLKTWQTEGSFYQEMYTTMNVSGFVLKNLCSMTWILLCCIGTPTIFDNPDTILCQVDQMNYFFYLRGLVG